GLDVGSSSHRWNRCANCHVRNGSAERTFEIGRAADWDALRTQSARCLPPVGCLDLGATLIWQRRFDLLNGEVRPAGHRIAKAGHGSVEVLNGLSIVAKGGPDNASQLLAARLDLRRVKYLVQQLANGFSVLLLSFWCRQDGLGHNALAFGKKGAVRLLQNALDPFGKEYQQARFRVVVDAKLAGIQRVAVLLPKQHLQRHERQETLHVESLPKLFPTNVRICLKRCGGETIDVRLVVEIFAAVLVQQSRHV